jgi:hypothetical protein
LPFVLHGCETVVILSEELSDIARKQRIQENVLTEEN